MVSSTNKRKKCNGDDKYLTRKEVLDSKYTIECPECGYLLIGDEPRIMVKCKPCSNKVRVK